MILGLIANHRLRHFLCSLSRGGHDHQLSDHPSLLFKRCRLVCIRCGHLVDARARA